MSGDNEYVRRVHCVAVSPVTVVFDLFVLRISIGVAHTRDVSLELTHTHTHTKTRNDLICV